MIRLLGTTLNDTDYEAMWNVYSDAIKDTPYVPVTLDFFKEHFYPSWANITSWGYEQDGKMVGVISGMIYDERVFVTIFGVNRAYQRQGIGNTLINTLEEHFKGLGYKAINFSNMSTINCPWYLKGDFQHNGAPGVMVNSPIYLFLLHHGYVSACMEDAFLVDLSTYNIPSNPAEGYSIGFYEPSEYQKVQDFCEDIKVEVPFVRCIQANLALPKPLPFLVVRHEDKIVGWTGALWNEPSGRGHFDGVCVSEAGRGKGIGTALFSRLMIESKKNGAQYMSFFTGLDNYARKIYLGIGGKIYKTFSMMRKKF